MSSLATLSASLSVPRCVRPLPLPPPERGKVAMLLVTQIRIVLLRLVVVPIRIHPMSGREGPTNLSVNDVAGQQIDWSDSSRSSVEGSE